jgi:uncharacterized membrane protein YbhN (UPF0104 family)
VTKGSRPAVGRARAIRFLLGAAIGVALLAITIARVDLASVVAVLAGASVPGLVLALVVVLGDLAIRSLRWQILLRALPSGRPATFGLAAGYLTIGYLANFLLPARLGDLARAYLAGARFGVGRLATLGTILVERVSDGGTMLVLAILSSLVVAGVAAVQTLALYAAVLVAAGIGALLVGWWVVTRTRVGATPAGRIGRDLAGRLSTGTAALRSVSGAASVAIATLAAAGTAILIAWLVTGAVGIALRPEQAVLFLSAIALSLAIPAAPGSIGTYEFVGVTVLTSLGHSPERALAAIVLMRAVSTLPLIGLGVASAWVLHIRTAVILETAATPVELDRTATT